MMKTMHKPVSKDFVESVLSTNKAAKAWEERKHLITTEDLTLDEISLELALARHFKENDAQHMPPLTVLERRTIATLFYENSTRTKSSFDLAARKLGATVLHLDIKTSSAAKGESLLDTAMNLYAMGVDAVIMRHSQSGAPLDLARQAKDQLNVINAGDGSHAHPSQGLLDLFTMLEHLGALPSLSSKGAVENALTETTLKGKKVAIVGDILHSRVARSNFWLLKKLGAEVHFAGPPALVPEKFGEKEMGAKVHHQLENAIKDADFIIALRIQMERQEQGLIASLDEYKHLYRLDHDRIKTASKSKNVRVLHPGPINRGVEITDELADDEDISLILTQVTNGILTRMSIIALLLAQSN